MRITGLILFMMLVAACSNDEMRVSQQVSKGAELYTKHCANCHQADGSGLAGLMPPLANTDYLTRDSVNLPCIIRMGMKGRILVNGKSYNQPMPAGRQLSDNDIANIVGFIQHKFMGRDAYVTDSLVKEMLQHCF